MKRDLCEWFVQNFDVPSSSMNLHGQSISLTVDDVSSILGLRNEGIDVATIRNKEEADHLCKRFNLPNKTKLTFKILEKKCCFWMVSQMISRQGCYYISWIDFFVQVQIEDHLLIIISV